MIHSLPDSFDEEREKKRERDSQCHLLQNHLLRLQYNAKYYDTLYLPQQLFFASFKHFDLRRQQ